MSGAGDGNRTHAICLGSNSSAIELHPRDPDFSRQQGAPTNFYVQRRAQRPEGHTDSNLIRAKPCDDTPLRVEQAQRSGFHVKAGDSSQRRKKSAFLPHAGVTGARGYDAFGESQGTALKRVASYPRNSS